MTLEDIQKEYPEYPLPPRALNLKNHKYGRLTPIYYTKKLKDKRSAWVCKCECGNYICTTTGRLRAQKEPTRSCGCLKGYQEKDITNKIFGKLTIIQEVKNKRINGHKVWLCRCECGTIIEKASHRLLDGSIKSCGCLKSYQNFLIQNLLNEYNILFNKEYRFDNLKQYSFDFLINNHYIIEYDGKQHFSYEDNTFSWNTENNFIKTRENDLIKNKYCFDNNIPIIRIPYDAEYTIDDLKLETTRFLLTPENEQEYYNRG